MTALPYLRQIRVAFLVALLPAITGAQANPRSGFVPLRADATAVPLSNSVTVSVTNASLGDVIRDIVQQAGLSVAIDQSLPGLEQRVSLQLTRVTAAAALVRALQDTSLQAMVSPTGQIVIVPRPAGRLRPSVLRGTVRETGSAEPVGGARVELTGTAFAAVSREDGSFSFGRVPAGEYDARVTRMGFRPVILRHVSVGEDADGSLAIPIAVSMERAAVPLSAVVVTPGYFGVMQASAGAAVAMSRQQIETVPQIGEDIYRAVNRLPGVSATDFSAKFFVRGGSSDELYATLDGLELVEPYHLKDILEGALSIVDSKAIGSLELTTGGFSSEYGDRLTGIFAMRSIDPRTDRTRTSLGASVMNVRATSQGGFARGRGGWLFSARRGYLDLALKLANASDSLSPTYYDTFGKVQYDLASGGRVAVHVLHAGDQLKYLDPFDPNIRSRYASSYAWLTWDDRFGSRVRQRTVASVGRLSWRREGDAFDGNGEQWLLVNDRRGYTVAGLRQDWSLDVATRILLKWGVDARRERSEYDYFGWRRVFSVDANQQLVLSRDTTAVAADPNSTRLGAYIASRVQPVRTVTAELGVRFDRATHTGDEVVNPRLNVAWHPASRTTIRGAWGKYSQSQPLFALQVQDGESSFHPAERAEQRVLGVEQVMTNGLVARAELYERRLSNLRPRYVNVGPAIEVFPEINWDRVRVDPTTGMARGVELFLARDGTEHVDWSVSYALASAREQIEDRTVPRAVDQRHTVHGDWSYRPTSNKWRLSVAWLWHSGWPYTPPLVAVDTLRDTPTEFQLAVRFYSGDIGSGRLPAYRRADVRWTRYFDTRRGRWSVFAEVYNLLNTQNPRGYYVNLNVDNQRRVTTTRGTETNIGRLPTAGITWEF
jgi:carboxypeptidase family protein/TonB-dependent receptor-like protein